MKLKQPSKQDMYRDACGIWAAFARNDLDGVEQLLKTYVGDMGKTGYIVAALCEVGGRFVRHACLYRGLLEDMVGVAEADRLYRDAHICRTHFDEILLDELELLSASVPEDK
jgi:hypothetical protein